MAIPQTTVNFGQAVGVPGELCYDGPVRAAPWTLVSTPNPNVVGSTAYTTTSAGIAAAGGTGVYCGVLCNPKVYANFNANLSPTMTLPDQTIGELVTVGQIFIISATACAIGDLVVFNNTTGALSTIAHGTSVGSGYTLIPGATVILQAGSAGGLAMVQLLTAA